MEENCEILKEMGFETENDQILQAFIFIFLFFFLYF